MGLMENLVYGQSLSPEQPFLSSLYFNSGLSETIYILGLELVRES